MPTRLSADFFEQDREVVAKALIGKVLIHQINNEEVRGIILETEAYGGPDDPAAHSFSGKSQRNWPLFGDAGLVYVYLIYGIHLCFNVSVGKPGEVGGVLIRGVSLLPDFKKISGPGRVGKTMNFTRADNGVQSIAPGSDIWFEDHGIRPTKVAATPRIGITKAVDKPWRFVGSFEFESNK